MPLSHRKLPISRRKPSPYWLPYLAAPVLLVGAGIAQGGEQPKAAPRQTAADQATYEQEIRPLLTRHCAGCHAGKDPSGGVDLSASETVASVQRDQATWRKVVTQLRERSMPPKGAPQPTEEQRDRLSLWLAHTLDNVPDGLLPKNPGRVLIHRLSRT